MASLDIQDFISTVSKSGLARVANFRVLFHGPTQLGDNRDLLYKTSKATYPGRNLSHFEYLTYGPVQKIATGSSYGDAEFSVYVSSDMNEKRYFEKWQTLACGWASLSMDKSAGMFDIGYYSDYIGRISIEQLDSSGNVTYTCILDEAWPTVVSQLDADWSSEDIHRLSVSFSYRYFIDGNDAQNLFPEMFDASSSITSSSINSVVGTFVSTIF